MDYIKSTNTDGTRPSDTSTGTPGYAHDENIGTNTDGTIINAKWFNDVIDEFKNVIVPTGAAFSSALQNQLYTAIQWLINDAKQAVTIVVPRSTTVPPTLFSYSAIPLACNGITVNVNMPTITIPTPPVGMNAVMCRWYVNYNASHNIGVYAQVRKNVSDTWQNVITLDSMGSAASGFENEHHVTFIVPTDTLTNNFEARLVINTSHTTNTYLGISSSMVLEEYRALKLL